MSLAQAIAATAGPDTNQRIGVVDVASPLTVIVTGRSIPVSRLSSYAPVVGDVVAMLRFGSTWLCLGKVV